MAGSWIKGDLVGMLSQADFAVPASWKPAGDATTHAAQVILSEPDSMVMDGGGALPDVVITLSQDDFPGIGQGDIVLAEGRRFKITRPVLRSGDGAVKVLECADLDEFELA
jgi:hypothetical protein